MEMQLGKLVHHKIVVLGPSILDQNVLETVTLLGVEETGIWIDSPQAAERVAEKFRVKPSAPSAFFIPFTQITTIIASIEAATAGEVRGLQ
jgi:hypothetical protein